MRVCITGPVHSDKYFGGVATFTESLADGFKLSGHEVIIVTDYCDKPTTQHGVAIEGMGSKVYRRDPRLVGVIQKAIVDFQPDLLVTSLEYGWVLGRIAKKLPNTLFYHFLHAFPAVTTGSYIKKVLLNGSMKYIAKYAHKMISNSRVTSVVNAEIYGIRVDEIIKIGVSYPFLEKVKPNLEKEPKTILFAGRLAKEKNIINYIKGLQILNERLNGQFKAYLAGHGPERAYLEEYAKEHNVPVEFLGQLRQKDLLPYYEKSEVFVSLNPHEPFGITYLEAILTQCKTVCPFTGGQLDFIDEFPGYFYQVNPYQPAAIADGVERALAGSLDPAGVQRIYDNYTFQRVADDITRLAEEKYLFT